MDSRLEELVRSGAVSRLLGYLNFSDGRPDPRWQRQLDDVHAAIECADFPSTLDELAPWLKGELSIYHASCAAAFRDTTQARAALRRALVLLPRLYRQHHADLLAHQTERELFPAFFLARAAEAVLSLGQGESDETIVAVALRKLNDFVGHRPVAVLETRAASDYYDHERFRPVPLYLAGAGVGTSRYHDLIARALDVLRDTDADLRHDAGFDLALLDELALDPRAYDHLHPVNKRPNYVFGEWDPHHLDNAGRYRRFVVRQCTLNALLARVASADPDGPHRDEYLHEAACVLAGVVLMAAGVSGPGPGAFDSGTTLATLLPRIARYRDAFYVQLLDKIGGEHGHRLRVEAQQARQPFGGARQHLNQALAQERALQLQERRLALLFAEMGQPTASRRRAGRIPTASVRFLSEIRLRLVEAGQLGESGELLPAAELLPQIEDLLYRGIGCGALVDPWNILGFQGLFPLTPAREDSVHDPRIEELLDVMARLFDTYASLMVLAASAGEKHLRKRLSVGMRKLAAEWDRYATTTVRDLPRVHGGERTAAAEHVAKALAAWRQRDASVPDLTFWRKQRGGFRSATAYVQVIEALLRQRELPAAAALLMAWLDQADEVPPGEGPTSLYAWAERWLDLATTSAEPTTAESAQVRKFFELLEANAGPRWGVPDLSEIDQAEPEDDGPSAYRASAFEGVTYRDSAEDGEEGAVAGGGPTHDPNLEFPFNLDVEGLTDRLYFLSSLARMWRTAAEFPAADAEWQSALAGWLTVAVHHRRHLLELLEVIFDEQIPQPQASFESVLAYDARREVKEHLLETAIATAIETSRAERALAAASDDPAASLLSPQHFPWETAAIAVERALARNDAAAVRAALPGFIRAFQSESLLFVPLAEGGHPKQILRARLALAAVRRLLERLPRLGLVRETYHLVKLARQMEQNSTTEGQRVTEFDRLFQIALPAEVEAILAIGADVPFELLREVVDSFLKLWLDHSESLRLTILEGGHAPGEWEEVRDFIRRYGDLFDAQFLTLSNLRGILHRGVEAYLDTLLEEDPHDPPRLVDDLRAGRTSRAEASRLLQVILQGLVENYEEYRDYNSTTVQSDYGENLHQLLDLLRVKARYERYAWRMRPLMLAHDVLCRTGHLGTARAWQDKVEELTRELAANLLQELGRREQEHGIRLRTVRDRLEERFVQPLIADRLAAAVAPAMREAEQAGGGPVFRAFEKQVHELTMTPSGVGLDAPAWLRGLEAAVQQARQERAFPPRHGPTASLTLADLQQQFAIWEQPLE